MTASRSSGAVRAALGALLAACANGAPDQDAPGPELPVVVEGAGVVLSMERTQAAIAVPETARNAEVLAFTITNVRNPDGSAISVHARLRLQRDTSRTETIGAVALFPVDSGGTFRLRVPPSARGLLARNPDSVGQLVLTLVVEPPQRAAAATLTIDRLQWEHSPD